jgi:ribulose-bisphosphate carboxylase large chain
LSPGRSADALAIEESVGMEAGPSLDFVRGRVVSEGEGVAVLEFPEDNWGANLPMLLSAVVAGEGVETAAFTRCRLVELDLGSAVGSWLPGPAFPAPAESSVGAIVKPSLGLRPDEVAKVAASLAEGGAALVKDDELMGDPPWCRLEERVRAVVSVLANGTIYCPNVTGPSASLLDRARRVVELGATGVMVNAFTQGLDAVLALRTAELGVPIFAHRVGSGPWVRNPDFGVSGAVLCSLTRLCGADFVQVGAFGEFGSKLFDSDAEVDAQLAAVRDPVAGVAAPVAAPTAVIGGGIGPHNARAQADRAGGGGLLLLLGSAAYSYPGGLVEGVQATVAALSH